MISRLNKPGRLLFAHKLLGLNFCFFALLSCTSISKVPLHSKNLIFKIKWDYSSSIQKEQESFNSLVFVQGNNLLRLDILQPFVGVVGSLILNHTTMTLQVPLKRSYYKGEFDSKIFFSDFPSFPSSWFVAFLRAKTPENWSCQKQELKLTQCKTDHFEVKWIYKNSQLYEIQLKDTKQRQIHAQIKSLSSKELSTEIFTPSLENLKREENPLFFQKIY